MREFAMTLNLKDHPESIEMYKTHHRNVWPEVISGLRDIGIGKMKIFLLGTKLFMYIETPDDFNLATDFGKYANSEKAAEWDTLMRKYQTRPSEAKDHEWWAEMEEVFDINWASPGG